MVNSKKLGLSLSGGGYRAAAFHLGTLHKLNELNILSRVDVLSTISGGSITGASYCLFTGPFPDFFHYMRKELNDKNVIRFVLMSITFFIFYLYVIFFTGLCIYFLFFSPWPWASFISLVVMLILFFKFQFRILPVSKEIEKAYDHFFYGHKKLKDLPGNPVLAIGSSNLQTGRPFTFSKIKMSDSTYGFYTPPVYFKNAEFPIARAVTASSCVPFAFTPVSIGIEYFNDADDYKRVDPKLIDGGVYDNQGIQKITQKGSTYECAMIITSDAGAGLSFSGRFHNTFTLLLRTVDLFMNRIKTVQMADHLYQQAGDGGKPIAYFSLGWELKNCIPGFIDNMVKGQVLPEILQKHNLKQEWIDYPDKYRNEITGFLENITGYKQIFEKNLTHVQWKIACNTGTNLTPLKYENIDYLITHAENLTELQVKLYCPSLISAYD